MYSQQIAKEMISFEEQTKERNLEKIKFCIISCHKTQLSRNRLLMFALENKY